MKGKNELIWCPHPNHIRFKVRIINELKKLAKESDHKFSFKNR